MFQITHRNKLFLAKKNKFLFATHLASAFYIISCTCLNWSNIDNKKIPIHLIHVCIVTDIGEFNKKRTVDKGKEYWGKSIACDEPQHYPKVNYYWTRNSFPNFVEEDQRVFVSHDGHLYFSSLEKIDNGSYSCNVQSDISDTGRTGPFFPVIVEPGCMWRSCILLHSKTNSAYVVCDKK